MGRLPKIWVKLCTQKYESSCKLVLELLAFFVVFELFEACYRNVSAILLIIPCRAFEEILANVIVGMS